MAPSSLLDNPQATTYTAFQTVFGTAELVEQILVHLPAKQLFSSQRVCKTFTNAIAASPEVQVKMWRRLPDCTQMQASGPADDSMENNYLAQPEISGEAELAINPQLRPVLSPWLVVIPRISKSWEGQQPREMKVRFSWRRSARQYFFTAKEDSYLDTYFCDPPCRTITVQQTYLVDGDDFENTQDVHIDKPMTIREVLDKALDQTGPVADSFSQEPVVQCGTMRAMINCHEQEKGCTDGSKTVLSKVEFVLHGVHDPVILDDATTGSNESMFSHRLPNRKIVTGRARASMAM